MQGRGAHKGRGGGSPSDSLLGRGRGGLGSMKKKKNPHPLTFEARVGVGGTRNLCLALGAREGYGGHECQLSANKACDFHVTLFGCLRGLGPGDSTGSQL